MTKESQEGALIHTGEIPTDPVRALLGNTYIKPLGDRAAEWIDENVRDRDRFLQDENGLIQHVVWKVSDEELESVRRLLDPDTDFEIYVEIADGAIRKIDG